MTLLGLIATKLAQITLNLVPQNLHHHVVFLLLGCCEVQSVIPQSVLLIVEVQVVTAEVDGFHRFGVLHLPAEVYELRVAVLLLLDHDLLNLDLDEVLDHLLCSLEVDDVVLVEVIQLLLGFSLQLLQVFANHEVKRLFRLILKRL